VEEELLVEQDGRTNTVNFKWSPFKKLLYLKWDGIYQLYAEQAVKVRQAEILPENSLKYYMEHCTAFVGKKRSVRFDNRVTSAMVFDYDKLGINLELFPADHTCEKCGTTFTGRGNLCKPCKSAAELPVVSTPFTPEGKDLPF
jgi:hypothetical protein